MEKGFHDQLKGNSKLHKVTLVKLKVPMSVGACYMAAAKAAIKLKTTYEENCEQFCQAQY